MRQFGADPRKQRGQSRPPGPERGPRCLICNEDHPTVTCPRRNRSGNGASGSGQPACGGFISHYGSFVDTVNLEPQDAVIAPLEPLDKDSPDGRSFARSPTENTGWLDAIDDARLESWVLEPKGATFTGGCKGSLQYGVATAYFSLEMCAGKLIIDSGASKTMGALQLVEEYQRLFYATMGDASSFCTLPDAPLVQMTFANGETRNSTATVRMPVPIGGDLCTVDAVLLDGPGPLLLSVNVLEQMDATIRFKTGLMLLGSGQQVQLARLPNGHYFVDLYQPLRVKDLAAFDREMSLIRSGKYKDRFYYLAMLPVTANGGLLICA